MRAGARSATLCACPRLEEQPSRLAELRSSARGWHDVQLAVIGFIGLCGVLQGGRPDNPMWLQVFAGLLAIVALVLACAATFLVARVAWPLYGGREPPVTDEAAAVERDGRRIKRGLVLTFAAVAVLALGTATGWWPQEETGGGGGGGLVTVESHERPARVRLAGASGERQPQRVGERQPARRAAQQRGRGHTGGQLPAG